MDTERLHRRKRADLTVTIETDLELPDGRTLHVYDEGGDDRLAVFWHHGTPNVGAPPVSLFRPRTGSASVASHDRPGYGGSIIRGAA